MDKIQDSYTWFELLSLGYTVVKLIFHENSGNLLSKEEIECWLQCHNLSF